MYFQKNENLGSVPSISSEVLDLFMHSYMHSWKSNHILLLLLKKPQIWWTNKRQNNQRNKKLFLRARHITCTFNFMRKQRNLGARHCLSTRLLFSNQTTIPRWGKKLYEFTSNSQPILSSSPNFHKLIDSLKIRGNYEFGMVNL